jgi:hypothetical protein
MKGQLNEVKALQKTAGLLTEAEEMKYEDSNVFAEGKKSYDLGPKIDLKKLSKVLNMIVDEDGEALIEPEEKKDILYAIKNMPTIIEKIVGSGDDYYEVDADDADEDEDSGDEYNDISLLEELPWDWHGNLPKNRQKAFQPLETAIIQLNTAAVEMDAKSAVKGYKMIYDFLEKLFNNAAKNTIGESYIRIGDDGYGGKNTLVAKNKYGVWLTKKHNNGGGKSEILIPFADIPKIIKYLQSIQL